MNQETIEQIAEQITDEAFSKPGPVGMALFRSAVRNAVVTILDRYRDEDVDGKAERLASRFVARFQQVIDDATRPKVVVGQGTTVTPITHFPLSVTVLCVEPDCDTIFSGNDDGTFAPTCPSCGSTGVRLDKILSAAKTWSTVIAERQGRESRAERNARALGIELPDELKTRGGSSSRGGRRPVPVEGIGADLKDGGV